MPKSLIRFVALLLVPCLVADPSTVSAFTHPLHAMGVRHPGAFQNRFNQEALGYADDFPHLGNSNRITEAIDRLAATLLPTGHAGQPRLTNLTRTSDKLFNPGRSLDYESLREVLPDLKYSQWEELLGVTLPGIIALDPSVSVREAADLLNQFNLHEDKFTLLRSLDIFLLPLLKGGRLITGMSWAEVESLERFLNEVYGFICDQIGRKREDVVFVYPQSHHDPNEGLAIRYRPDIHVFEVRPEHELIQLYPVRTDPTGGHFEVISSIDETTSRPQELREALNKAFEIHANWRSYLDGNVYTPVGVERELAGRHSKGFDFEIRPGGHDYVEIDFSGPVPVIVIPESRMPDPKSINYEWQKKRLAADLVSELNHLYHPEISPDKADAEMEPESLLMLVAYYGIPIAFKELHESYIGLFAGNVAYAYEIIEEYYSDILKKDKSPLDQVAFLQSETGKQLMDLIFTPDLWTWENDFIINPDGSKTPRVKNPVKEAPPDDSKRFIWTVAKKVLTYLVEQKRNPYFMLKPGQVRRARRGRYKFIKVGDVTVFIYRPDGFSANTPVVYVNTGGVASLLNLFKQVAHYKAADVRPHLQYWDPEQIGDRLALQGFAVCHVTGADIENPGIAHQQKLETAAQRRVKAIFDRMQAEGITPESHPTLISAASIGAAQVLELIASGDASMRGLRGHVYLNAAIEFAEGAAEEMAIERPLKEWKWGAPWQMLLPLMPGTPEAKLYKDFLQRGLRQYANPATPTVYISTIAPEKPDASISGWMKVMASVFHTPGTDGVVNANFACGLGPDGKALIPGSSSIVVSGIDHFTAPIHPMIIRIQEDLLKQFAVGRFLSDIPVEVNGRIVGKLSDFTPERPLQLHADDMVRFGPTYRMARWGRYVYTSWVLPMSDKEKGITGAAMVVDHLIPEPFKINSEALSDYIQHKVHWKESYYWFIRFVTIVGLLLLVQKALSNQISGVSPILWATILIYATNGVYVLWSLIFGLMHDVIYKFNWGKMQWYLAGRASFGDRLKLAASAMVVHLPILGAIYLGLKVYLTGWNFMPGPFLHQLGLVALAILVSLPMSAILHKFYNALAKFLKLPAMTFGHKRGAAKKLQVPRPVATDKSFLKDFGKLIKRLRENKGWKPADLSREAGITPKQLAEIETGRRWLTEQGRGPVLAKALGYDYRPFYREYEVISWVSNPDGTPLYVTQREAIIYYMAKNNVTHGMLEERAKLGSPQLEDYLDAVRPIRPPLATMVKIKNVLKGLELEIRDPRLMLKQLMQDARAEKRELATEKKSPRPKMAPSSKSNSEPILLEGGMLSPSHGVFSKIRSHRGESLDLTLQVPTELEYEKAFPPTLRAFSIQWRRTSVERRFSNGKMETVTEDEESVTPGQFWVTYKAVTSPAPMALYSRIPEHILNNPIALMRYIDVDVPNNETYFFMKLLGVGFLLTMVLTNLFQVILSPYPRSIELIFPMGIELVLAHTFVSFYFGGLHDMVFHWSKGNEGIPQWIPSPASLWTRFKLGIAAWLVHLPLLGGAYYLLKIWMYVAHHPFMIFPVALVTLWIVILATLLTVIFHGSYNTKKMKDGGAAMTLGAQPDPSNPVNEVDNPRRNPQVLRDFAQFLSRRRKLYGFESRLDLAKTIHWDVDVLRDIENAKTFPDPVLAEALGIALHFDHARLFKDYEITPWPQWIAQHPDEAPSSNDAFRYVIDKTNADTKQLAKQLGIGPQSLIRILSNQEPLSRGQMKRLAQLYPDLHVTFFDVDQYLKELLAGVNVGLEGNTQVLGSDSSAPTTTDQMAVLQGGKVYWRPGVKIEVDLQSPYSEGITLSVEVTQKQLVTDAFPDAVLNGKSMESLRKVEQKVLRKNPDRFDFEHVSTSESHVTPGTYRVLYAGVVKRYGTKYSFRSAPMVLDHLIPEDIKKSAGALRDYIENKAPWLETKYWFARFLTGVLLTLIIQIALSNHFAIGSPILWAKILIYSMDGVYVVWNLIFGFMHDVRYRFDWGTLQWYPALASFGDRLKVSAAAMVVHLPILGAIYFGLKVYLALLNSTPGPTLYRLGLVALAILVSLPMSSFLHKFYNFLAKVLNIPAMTVARRPNAGKKKAPDMIFWVADVIGGRISLPNQVENKLIARSKHPKSKSKREMLLFEFQLDKEFPYDKIIPSMLNEKGTRYELLDVMRVTTSKNGSADADYHQLSRLLPESETLLPGKYWVRYMDPALAHFYRDPKETEAKPSAGPSDTSTTDDPDAPMTIPWTVPKEIRDDHYEVSEYIRNQSPENETVLMFVGSVVANLAASSGLVSLTLRVPGFHMANVFHWMLVITPVLYLLQNLVFGFLHTSVYRWNVKKWEWQLHPATTFDKLKLAFASTGVHANLLVNLYIDVFIIFYFIRYQVDFFLPGLVIFYLCAIAAMKFTQHLHWNYNYHQQKEGGVAMTVPPGKKGSKREPISTVIARLEIAKMARQVLDGTIPRQEKRWFNWQGTVKPEFFTLQTIVLNMSGQYSCLYTWRYEQGNDQYLAVYFRTPDGKTHPDLIQVWQPHKLTAQLVQAYMKDHYLIPLTRKEVELLAGIGTASATDQTSKGEPVYSGKRLLDVRTKRGWRASHIASRLGYSMEQLATLELLNSPPLTRMEAERIAQVLSFSSGELIEEPTPPETMSFRFPKIIKGQESWPVFEHDLQVARIRNPHAIMNQGVMWVKEGSRRIEQQPYDVLNVLAGTLSKLLGRPVSVAEMLNAIRIGEENIHLAVPAVLRSKIDDDLLQVLGKQEYERVWDGLARMYGYLPSTLPLILADEIIAKFHFEAMLGNPLRLMDHEGQVFVLPDKAQKAILQYVMTIPAFLGVVQNSIEEMDTSHMEELHISLVNLISDLKDVRNEEDLQKLSQFWDETMGTVIPMNFTLEDHMRLLQRAISLESKLVATHLQNLKLPRQLLFDAMAGMLALHVAALTVNKALVLWHAPQALVLFIGIILPLAVAVLAFKYVAPHFTSSRQPVVPRVSTVLSQAA